jgi:hypothetical protein
MVQRLEAGAQGVSFLPTHSILGSSMEKENRDDFLVMDDPFRKGEKLGLVRAINADLSFYHALAADPFIFNLFNVPTCKMLTDVSEVLGILMGGKPQRCLGALSSAQVDRWGNLNSTIILPNLLITGSGGANDVASGATEVVVVVPQSPFRVVPEVSYITAPGQRVRTLVTTLGMFEKLGGNKEFTLTGTLEDGKSPAEERVRVIKEQCEWELKIATQLKILRAPTPDELALLRLFDPHKFFLTEAS